MAFRKQKQRILAGSLNLAPPADLTPEPDSVALENWRIDAAGALVSRKGMVADATGLGASVHSLFRIAQDRYGGVGTDLKLGANLGTAVASGFDGEPVGFAAMHDFVWVMNRGRQGKAEGANFYDMIPAAPEGTLLATPGGQLAVTVAEFDSTEGWDLKRWSGGVKAHEPTAEVEIASAGSVSVTNGSADIVGFGTAFDPTMVDKNILIRGSNFDVHSVVAAVTDATHLTLIDGYNDVTASSLGYQITETFDAKTFDASNLISGSHSLSINCNPAARWQVELDFPTPVDCTIQGVASDEDRFAMWVYAENPRAVVQVKVTLFSGTGNIRQAVTATIPASALNPADFSWTRVQVSRGMDPFAYVETNPDYQDILRRTNEASAAGNQTEFDTLNGARIALFQALVADAPFFKNLNGPEFDWTTVTTMWVEVEVSEPSFVHFDKAEFIGGATGALEGEFTFFASYANDWGQESNGGAQSAGVVLQKQAVTIDAIPVSPDAQVTMRHLYIIGGPLDVPLRCATISDNVTSGPVTLHVDLRLVQRNKYEMPVDHDPPPAARGLVMYRGGLVAYSSAAHPNRFWYTPTAKPYAWPGAADEAIGNWDECGDAGEEIVHVTAKARMLVFYKERSIWRLVGDPDVSVPERTSSALAVWAACDAGAYDYVAGPAGVYRFNGDTEVDVSEKLRPLFQGDRVKLADGISVAPVSRDAPRTSYVLAYRQGVLYFSYPEQGQTLPNVTLMYDERLQRWGTMRSSVGGFTSIYFEGGGAAHGLMGGTAAGGLYYLDDRATDAGAAISVVWQSRAYDMGIPDNDKVCADLVVIHRTADESETPSALTVKLIFDDGTVENIGSISSSQRSRSVFPLGAGGKGRTAANAAVRLEGDITSKVWIYAVYLHWYPEARKAKTFDTGVIALAEGGRVGEVDEFRFDLTAAGTVNWEFHTDLPGNALAVRETGTVVATGGERKVMPARFDAARGVKGRLIATSDQDFQVHDLHMHALAIGEYIDGASGDFWESRAA